MRRTSLKHATTGVVITVVFAVVFLGVLRARVIHSAGKPDQQGAALFADKGCAHCHYTDKKDTKIGPGLEGLFARERLPVSDRPVNEQNVRRQLETPYKEMPSFAGRLTEQETESLIAYLKSL